VREMPMAEGSGLLPRANPVLDPGEVSEAEGEARGREAILDCGVSDLNDVCDLRERSEERGRRPAVRSGELSSTSLSSFAAATGEEADTDEVDSRYFAGSFLEMASAKVCFLNLVSGLSAAGLTLVLACEIRLVAPDGVGKPERK